MVSYTYDAWGKLESVSGSLASTIGELNPFRYRGYYYDTECGLYYLQSRYYDPVTSRFINADGLVSTGQGIFSQNMFAYCENNPIIRQDLTGRGWEILEKIADKLGELMVASAPAYAGSGGVALSDGPLPFGDAVAGVFDVGLTIVLVVKATNTVITQEKSKTKEKEKKPVVFPVSPYTFHPVGLIPHEYTGNKNGKIIKWELPNKTAIFEWDEGLNEEIGPHYHCMLAERLGSSIFQIATKVWNGMSATDQWGANRAFLDKIIQSGQKITLQTNASKATGYFLKEINYLLSNGYKIVESGWSMVKK